MNLGWIRSSSDKARRIKDLPKEESGRDASPYDFFTGCYGNPDADVAFIPEIPSLTPKKIVAEAYSRHSEKLCTTAWKVTVHDLLFRMALYRNNLIDDPLSDEPWKWNCWVTDFVKKGEYTHLWNRMSKVKRGDAIRKSGKLLEQELRILCEQPRPLRRVIFVGHRSESYFDESLNGLDRELGFSRRTVYHYAWPKSEEQRKVFFEEFEKALRRMPR